MEVAVKSPGLTVLPEGATFEFGGWTLDYYNSTFYPFAEKSKTKATHTAAFYENSFYTKDPNFATPGHRTGIILNELDDREPFVTWKKQVQLRLRFLNIVLRIQWLMPTRSLAQLPV